jgi:hypothetical protein
MTSEQRCGNCNNWKELSADERSKLFKVTFKDSSRRIGRCPKHLMILTDENETCNEWKEKEATL